MLALSRPWAGDKEPPGQVFRVSCQEVDLKLTLPAKAFGRSLRQAILEPFLRAFAKKKKHERKVAATADDIERVEVDGMAVSDAFLAASFATGVDVVKVRLTLKPPADAPAKSAEVDDDDGEPRVSVHADLNKYYSKWSTFDDDD